MHVLAVSFSCTGEIRHSAAIRDPVTHKGFTLISTKDSSDLSTEGD